MRPHGDDTRFSDPVWSDEVQWDLLKQWYLFFARHIQDALFETPGLSAKERRRAAFWVGRCSTPRRPRNLLTNPAALFRSFETGGKSLADGLRNFMSDLQRGTISMVDEHAFEVGKNLATTPGAVVYRNDLLELLQYSPTTETVHEVPILFVPPWINKYYILDLDAKKSLIRYLVNQGFTVFTVSWKNPASDMRDVALDEYMLKGVGEAVEAARQITGAKHVHLSGYCIGGTIVACYMAWMNRTAGNRKALPVWHWSTLATLVDFANPGDIDVLISEAGIAYLEKRMAEEGYLDGADMAGAFRMLRANSLIWHYWVRNYLHGETPRAMDVLYWNMDTTRMPEAMHAFYLRELYLENKLAQKDGLTLGGRRIDLGRIGQPLYAVGTEQDHIAPWTEAFKICGLVKGPVRYALSTSGHILGIVNPPVDPPKRSCRVAAARRARPADGRAPRPRRTGGAGRPDWSGCASQGAAARSARRRRSRANHPSSPTRLAAASWSATNGIKPRPLRCALPVRRLPEMCIYTCQLSAPMLLGRQCDSCAVDGMSAERAARLRPEGRTMNREPLRRRRCPPPRARGQLQQQPAGREVSAPP